METKRSGISVGGVLVILALVMVLILSGTFFMIRETARGIVAPFNESNNQLKTQVNEILHPTPTILPDPITIINEIRSLARLETIQYSVEKVITAEIGQGNFSFLFGDKLLFVAHGIVIAGLDMNKMTSSDMWLIDDTLYVKVPEPEIFIATLDNEKSYVYDRETGLLNKGNLSLESQARIVAENEIKKASLADGIIELARQNGDAYLERVLNSLGFHVIVFLHKTPEP